MIPGLSSDSGRIGVLAIDHRDSLRAVINPAAPETVARQHIVDLKHVIIEELADLATGVMLEPEYSIPDLVSTLPDGVGFTAALESQGYSADPSAVPTELLEGWSPQAAKDAGASAAKLLAYYSPSAPEHAAAQRAVIAESALRCQAVGLPLILEPLAFPGGDHGPDTITAVRSTVSLGADLMKVSWPGEAFLPELIDALGGRPWVMLSGGGDFADYLAQVTTAVAHGCTGFMAGRAVWREVTQVAVEDRARTLREIARPRFEQLREALG